MKKPWRLSVLIIDDDRAVRASLAALCMQEGFDVATLATPARAMARIRKTRVDLVLLDLDIPAAKIGPLELLGQMRAFDDDLEIVVMPGAVAVETLTRAIEVRLAGCIQPPLTREELRELIARIARRHPLRTVVPGQLSPRACVQ